MSNIKFAHTNIIANDWKRLARFYENVFDCKYLYPERNLQGEFLDQGTNLRNAHLQGVHLRLPGFGENGPTLEIYGSDQVQKNSNPSVANVRGIGHIAFEVKDVGKVVQNLVQNGGKLMGQISETQIQNVGNLTFVYALDPENNIVQIQKWIKYPLQFMPNESEKEERQNSVINSVGSLSMKGEKPNSKLPNQDKIFVEKSFGKQNNQSLFAVFDGHGPCGHLVSEYVAINLKKNLIKELQKIKDDELQIRQEISKAFSKVNKTLLAEPKIDTQISGSCGVVVYQQDQKLICANIGDTRAILGKHNSITNWKFQGLSIDHKPETAAELRRIQESGGRVQPDKNNPQGPQRIWLPDIDLPGLAMSRAFGDFLGTQVGLIAVPDILQFQLSSEDKFLVIASDGIWEFLSPQLVMETVVPFFENKNNYSASQEACNKLVEMAKARWKENENYIDDMSVVIVFIDSNSLQGRYIDAGYNESGGKQYVPKNANLQKQLEQQREKMNQNYL